MVICNFLYVLYALFNYFTLLALKGTSRNEGQFSHNHTVIRVLGPQINFLPETGCHYLFIKDQYLITAIKVSRGSLILIQHMDLHFPYYHPIALHQINMIGRPIRCIEICPS